MKRSLQSIAIALSIAFSLGTLIAQQAPPPVRTPLHPNHRDLKPAPPLNFRDAAKRERDNPGPAPTEIEEIEAPQPPPVFKKNVPIHKGSAMGKAGQSTPLTGNGPSPGPSKTFKAEFLSSTSIPPDTMGAVGTTHIVTVTNDRMRIQTRDGIELARMTLTSFWSGVTIKGAAVSAFDPKVFFDRFNNRFMVISSANAQNVNSGACFAVSATADPTGVWYRWSVAADATSTAGGGHWIDYPTVGHNMNWIVVNENVFNFGTAGTGFWGTQIYALDKQAAYSNTLGTISVFEGDFVNTCLPSATPETEVACGFTMAPAITEDNTTDTEYLVEDWDSQAAQLRLSKITGTPGAPVLTVGTQFPQSDEAWRFDAARIGTANNCGGTCSGGYMPQRQQSANLTSGTRVMANDSRIQNSVLRNGKLWTDHTVMLAATSQPAGTAIGGTGNPVDTHSGIQWWQIDPTNETGSSLAPLQRGRIHDPSADNCHNGAGGTNTVGPRCTSTATQHGEFYAFPNISVNQNEDVFIGFTRFSALTYPNSAYTIRRSTDPANTLRDPVVFRPGQANYNIGGGSGTARQNRWGDYSEAQTDPVNDMDFWSVQEYSGTVRDFGIGLAGNWETWWTLVSPTTPAPSNGTLIISEFRLSGPQGVRDEFVELYNPGVAPVIVGTTDGSDGWALAYSTNGTTISNVVAMVPNGTVIPAQGHFLIADNPDGATGPTLVYSLNGAASTQARGADSDTGWSLDLPDNGGIALFNTGNSANFNASTRLDSAGFSSIAAGLFKEGNGIPAVTASTPTGQMTFFRDLSSGIPQDTGANETDFVFANPVVGETLGSSPKLGAAGPENLDSPVHLTNTTLASALVDSGAGKGTTPNLLRDATVVSNGAFGTIRFIRTFTNNTGSDLKRLRFRIVNTSTAPVVGLAADLRAISSGATVVTLSGGGTANVGATTLETPPTQNAGGGFNASLSPASVTNDTPLVSGGSINVAFTVGVQGTGQYSFCLVPEGDAAPGSAPLCFAGTTENNPPSITPGSLALNAGDPAASTTIATVSDVEDSAGSLTVTAVSVPAGISVTGITNTSGTVTAMVSASCAATAGVNNVILQVIDSEGATTNATFVVTVTATPTPSVSTINGTVNGTGTSDQACPEQPLTLTATSAGATSYQWYSDNSPISGATASTVVVTGAATYSVTATNNCGTSSASAGYVVQNPTPHKAFVTAGGPTTFCTGGSVTLSSDSATGIQWYQWYLNGNPIGGATNQAYMATASGNYTVVVTSLGCSSAASAAMTVTVNPLPATPSASNGGPYVTGNTISLSTAFVTGASYSWTGPNGFASPLQNPTIPNATLAAGGTYSVTITVSGCTSAPGTTTVVVTQANRAPVLDPIGDKSIAENSMLTFTINATDADNDTLTFSATNLPAGASFDTGTRTFSWTPTFDQSGTYTNVTFSVSDGRGGTASESITITVTNTNRPPVLVSIGNRSIRGPNQISFAVSASDPDGDSFTLSAMNLPSGSTFNPANGTFSWAPTRSQIGSYQVTFQATDSNNAVAAETITISVTFAASDFNGDSHGDILLTDQSGSLVEWQMNGFTITSGALIGTPGSAWRVAATGDFNGDGRTDVILQNNTTGDIVEWQMNGNVISAGAVIGSLGTNWQVATAGDFNGDGRSDLILQNTSTGDIVEWQMNGFSVTGGAIIATLPTTWSVVGAGDFDADGHSDLVLQNSATNEVVVWEMNGMTITFGQALATPVAGWKVTAVGDFNGDGKSDVVLQNTSTRAVAEWQCNGAVITSGLVISTPAPGWVVRGTADYNSDGRSDLLLGNSNSGDVAVWQMNGFTFAGAVVGTPGPAFTPVGK